MDLRNIIQAFMTCIVVTLFCRVPEGAAVYITVLTGGHGNVESTENAHFYQCYRSHPDTDASLVFGRSAPIPSLSSPPPPPAEPHSTSYPNVTVVTFPNTASWHIDGFGPFFCQATTARGDVTRITTFFQRSDAKFRPTDEVFTKTVNVNDTGVVINMEVRFHGDTDENVATWRKDGGDPMNGGQHQYVFQNPIQASDEGIYEIYYNNERDQGRGSLYRIIVRDCTPGKWGPPECSGVCDKCYNGGVCDDQTGICICPNNFKGANCLEVCRPGGGNRFGFHCDFRCTYLSPDNPEACHDHMFCLPDPYGCSCDVGVKGHACDSACDVGEYGAGCSQSCHCAGGTCNRYTGECTDTTNQQCQVGWSGENCQIPDECDDGYYGPQCVDKCHCLHDVGCSKVTGECPQQRCAAGFEVHSGNVSCKDCKGARWGLNCDEACHCAETSCNKVTGMCDGQCLDNWIESDCKTGIVQVSNVKTNPYQATSFTCYVEGIPTPDPTDISLYKSNGLTNNYTGITRVSSTLRGHQLAVTFNVENIQLGDYVCVLSWAHDTARLIAHAVVYVLPVIEEAPSQLLVTTMTVELQWNSWKPGDDIGDPALVGYVIYFKTTDQGWHDAQSVLSSSTSITHQVRDLDFDTDYDFSVAAVREGPGGTGSRSPTLRVSTLCPEPSASPFQVSAQANRPQQLIVSWQLPRESTANCRSGLTGAILEYRSSSVSAPWSRVTINDTTSSEYILTNLQTYQYYDIRMKTINKDAESDGSSVTTGRTSEEVAPSPTNFTVSGRTDDSFTVAWSAADPFNLNGDIQGYDLRYRLVAPEEGEEYKEIAILDTSRHVEYTVHELQPENVFLVEVRTVNGAGRSEWSWPVYALTTSGTVPGEAMCGISTVSIGLGICLGIALIGVVIMVIVTCVRNTKSPDNRKWLSAPRKAASPVYEEPSIRVAAPTFQDLEARCHANEAVVGGDEVAKENAYENGGVVVL